MSQKIALLCIHWLGDSFWDAQTIPKLEEQFNGAEIFIICKSHSIPIFSQYINLSNIINCDSIFSDRKREKSNLFKFVIDVKRCRNKNFDLIIDFSNNRYSAIFSFLVCSKKRIGIADHKFTFLYTDCFAGFDYNLHLSKRPWYIIKKIFPTVKYQKPRYFPSFKNSKKEKIALLVPGAGWEAKRWPLNIFIDVGNELIKRGYKVYVSGSPSESDVLNEVCRKVKLCQRFKGTMSDLIQFIPRVSVSVSNDSGPGHLLAASGTAHAALFTNETNPACCMPLGTKVKVFKINEENNYRNIIKFLVSHTKDI